MAATGLAAVRRPTGGRALLHAREVTYSATFTLAAEAGWRDAYSAINRILQGALQTIGVNATLAASRPPMAPDGPVCFDQPAEGELVMAGRKLVGSAVWRQGMRYLQHGSILLHDDQALLSRAAVCPLPPTPPAAALATVRPDLDAWGLQGALDAALREQLRARVPGAFVTGFTPDASLLAEIRSGRHEFTNEQRLWRR